MIKGVHTMFYSSEPEALRAFFRDQVGLPAQDVGDGWLIFAIPEADLGVHPTGGPAAGDPPSGTPHISFYCDDIESTVAGMKSRGVQFTMPIEDHGYGFVTMFGAPGGLTIQLYQPKYGK